MKIKSLNQLFSVSKKIADNLSHSDFIFLYGEIGSGKTTFTRNLINYLQEKENVKKTEVLSPTFNLLYEYYFKNYKIIVIRWKPFLTGYDLIYKILSII